MKYHFLWFDVFFIYVILKVSVASSQDSCKVVFENKENGRFSSPNFPSGYPEYSNCKWTFAKVKESEVVTVKFDAFMIEPSPNCSKAYVEVTSFNQKRAVSEKYCGKHKPFKVQLNGPEASVVLITDSNTGYPGFHAQFTIAESTPVSKIIEHGTSKSPNIPLTNTSSCECGKAKRIAKRIVGGSASEVNEYPWLVVLVTKESDTSAHCGAALITTKHVLTAAHCTAHRQPQEFQAIIGAHNLMTRDKTQQVRGVVDIRNHERYSHSNETNDIAILTLDQEVTLNDATRTICLPPLNHDFKGEFAVAAGWGKTDYGGKNSDTPLEVHIPVVANKECKDKFSATAAVITENNLCAGVLNGEKDACQGDSGGPLMWQNNSQWHLIGIVSYGVKCATPGFYGVYTRVSKYEEWINNVTKQNSCI